MCNCNVKLETLTHLLLSPMWTDSNVHVLSYRLLSRWMRIPFETLDPLYKSKMYRDKYQCLLNAMADASASVAVVTAYTRQKLCAATEGEIDEITDSLVQMADDQELAIDQRALVSYSILVFACKMVSVQMWTWQQKRVHQFFGHGEL